MAYVEFSKVVLFRVMFLWTASASDAKGAAKVLGDQLSFTKAACDGVVNTEVSADSLVSASLSFKTGAAGSANTAGKRPPRATKAIRASITCLIGFALSRRYP